MAVKGNIARNEFRVLYNLLMTLVLIFIFAEASAKEKLTCDPIDAPHIDPQSIISSIEKRISALDELQAGLRKTRDELMSASTIEQWSNAGVLLAQTLKSTSAVALTVSGALATVPEALAVSVVSSSTNLVIDAINNSQESQDKILYDTLTSYGASNAEMLGSNLLKAFGKSGMAGAWSTILGLGSFIKETFDLGNLAEIYGSANMHTQIKGINKQIAKYEKEISILKTELERTKKLVTQATQKVNTEFINILAEYNKSNAPICKKSEDLADKRKQFKEKMNELRKKVDSGNFGVGNNAREAANQQIGKYEKTLDHYHERGQAAAASSSSARSSALSAAAIQASELAIQQMQRHAMENIAVQQNSKSQNYYEGNSSSSAGATSNYVCVEWRTVRHHCEVAGDTNCGQLVQECTRTESR